MLVAGIDVGSLTAKAVIMENNKFIGGHIISTGIDSLNASSMVFDKLMTMNGLHLKDIDYIVATGYGRVNVNFAQKQVTEITCHARGSNWYFPYVRTILDVGGQDCKVIHCDENGRVVDFELNDKCAAGTGRYLERMARLVKLPLEEIGLRSLISIEHPLPINNACVVFAENDVLEYLRMGHNVDSILSGIIDALANRFVALIKRIGFQPEFSVSGGVAKNIGVVKRLENKLSSKAKLAPDTQLVGAIGGAIIASELARAKYA